MKDKSESKEVLRSHYMCLGIDRSSLLSTGLLSVGDVMLSDELFYDCLRDDCLRDGSFGTIIVILGGKLHPPFNLPSH